jgi:hypothetical protein
VLVSLLRVVVVLVVVAVELLVVVVLVVRPTKTRTLVVLLSTIRVVRVVDDSILDRRLNNGF